MFVHFCQDVSKMYKQLALQAAKPVHFCQIL